MKPGTVVVVILKTCVSIELVIVLFSVEVTVLVGTLAVTQTVLVVGGASCSTLLILVVLLLLLWF